MESSYNIYNIYFLSTLHIYISRQGVRSLSPRLRHHYLQPVCERHAPAEVGVAPLYVECSDSMRHLQVRHQEHRADDAVQV